MYDIMISIKPYWAYKIMKGEKTIEVRKTAPKAPFRAFIYCTKQRLPNKKYLYINETSVRSEYGVCDDWLKYDTDTLNINEGTPYQYKTYFANGKIIGEFICDSIEMFTMDYRQSDLGRRIEILKEACLTYEEAMGYQASAHVLYAWHISDLKIYAEPKELSEFNLTRPPQSWQYIGEDK